MGSPTEYYLAKYWHALFELARTTKAKEQLRVANLLNKPRASPCQWDEKVLILVTRGCTSVRKQDIDRELS